CGIPNVVSCEESANYSSVTDQHLPTNQRIARFAAILICFCGLAIFALRLPQSPDAATALCFFLAGVALWCSTDLVNRARMPVSRAVRDGCAALIVLVGLLRIADGRFPASMPPGTALALLIVGSALLLSSSTRFIVVFQILNLSVTLIGWLGLN